ncbi:MAG: hypothetical protein JXM71_03575 [Spirochaetales bacterium]|nr:hypothetical protein [Spirochaetales bacterium]
MNDDEYTRFVALRDSFRRRVAEWSAALPALADAQRALASDVGDSYRLDTPIVYNRALDDIGPEANISWVVVADNPGKREQEAGMNRYLVGRSGLMAERFFSRELGVDFRREVAIINKTPVHTPKTAQLRKLAKLYPEARPVLEDSQRFMASLVAELQRCFGARVWVMGLSEVRVGGLFGSWQEELVAAYERAGKDYARRLYGYNHFSMGSFSTDLKRRRREGETVEAAVLRIGAENRERILGGSGFTRLH